MTPFFVADVGNSRIKVRLCADDGRGGFGTTDCEPLNLDWILRWASAVSRSAPPEEIVSWPWTIAAVNPRTRDRLVKLLGDHGFRVRVLSDFREIPIQVDVAMAERVGIDRLLAAYAAWRDSQGKPVAVISAGTAVTVDLMDSTGTFRGGVILPGFRLMARSLHEHTAALPLIDRFDPTATIPARNTEAAISAGIVAAVAGAIDRVVEQYQWIEPSLTAILTGGDEELLTTLKCKPVTVKYLPLQGLCYLVHGFQ